MATGNTTSYSFEIEKMFNRADKNRLTISTSSETSFNISNRTLHPAVYSNNTYLFITRIILIF